MAKPKLYSVPFLCGDGSGKIMLKVKYFAEFLRGGDKYGTCAFCEGDPCAENSPPDSRIAQFFKRNKWAETCPCCRGRAT